MEFITGLGLLLVDLTLRLAIDGPYILSELIIYATDMGQFDIILVDTMSLKFFTIGSPTLMYIFLTNLALSIFLLVNPTIFYSSVVKILDFYVVYEGLKTYSHCLFLLELILPLLV